MKTLLILKNAVNLIGSSVGVILLAVGSVMLLNAVLKGYVFGLEKDSYYSQYECDHILYPLDYDDRLMAFEEVDLVTESDEVASDGMTDEERQEKYKACQDRMEERAQEQFHNRTMHSMIDGLTAVIVGGALLWYYSRRPKKHLLEE